jgi:signal transduction protein with GAF and PtsI domain
MTDRGSELIRRLARLATEVGPALVPVDHRELITSIADAAKEVFHAQACSVAVLDADREHLVFYAASTDAGEIVGQRVPIDRGIAGWVVASGQPLAVADAAADPRFSREFAERTGYVPRSILAMPLETEREMLGVVEVLDPSDAAGGPAASLDLLAVFARQAALALAAALAFADLGRVLLTALAESVDDGDLRAALLAAAADPRVRTAEVARLAALFAELARVDPEVTRAAVEVVEVLLAHARRTKDPA